MTSAICIELNTKKWQMTPYICLNNSFAFVDIVEHQTFIGANEFVHLPRD